MRFMIISYWNVVFLFIAALCKLFIMIVMYQRVLFEDQIWGERLVFSESGVWCSHNWQSSGKVEESLEN